MNPLILTFVLCLLKTICTQDLDAVYNVAADGHNDPASTLSINPARVTWVSRDDDVTTTIFATNAPPTITAAVIWDGWYTAYNGIYEMSLVTSVISVNYATPSGNMENDGCQNNPVFVGCNYREHFIATVAEGKLSGNLIMTQTIDIGDFYFAHVANYVAIKNLSISVEGNGPQSMYQIQLGSGVSCFDTVPTNYTIVDNNGCGSRCDMPTYRLELATALPDSGCSASNSLRIINNRMEGTTTNGAGSTTAKKGGSTSQGNDNPSSIPHPTPLPTLTTVQSTDSSVQIATSVNSTESELPTSPPAPAPKNNGHPENNGQHTTSTSNLFANSGNLLKISYAIMITCSLSLVLLMF